MSTPTKPELKKLKGVAQFEKSSSHARTTINVVIKAKVMIDRDQKAQTIADCYREWFEENAEASNDDILSGTVEVTEAK